MHRLYMDYIKLNPNLEGWKPEVQNVPFYKKHFMDVEGQRPVGSRGGSLKFLCKVSYKTSNQEMDDQKQKNMEARRKGKKKRNKI